MYIEHVIIILIITLQVFFAKPKVATEIIVHLGSDGIDELNLKQTIRVELLTNENTTKTTSPELQSISCLHNPIKIPILHDLTQPFFLTKGECHAIATYLC